MIRTNLQAVMERVRKACERSGRDAGEVRIMAVTKAVAAPAIAEAIEAGLVLFGENRVQEARKKVSEGAFRGVSICMIGHLQTNKASMAARIFDEVHSVDSARVAGALAKYASLYRSDPLGTHGSECRTRCRQIRGGARGSPFFGAAHNVPLVAPSQGLMTVAPLSERSRPGVFPNAEGPQGHHGQVRVDPECLKELSMGMSGDFELAVEEGATIIRLGTSLFGPRS